MIVPTITADDIAALGTLAADLSFADFERQAVLLESGTKDVNAAPGSGKTTILAAKLLLLGRKWPHERRGICVLSHTNVARDEIRRRLASSAEGSRLLSYPHFIGTIHAFVNQFLALPHLRSLGIAVDVIDDDAFAVRAVRKARANYRLNLWMDSNPGVEPMVEGLIYQGENLDLASENGKIPSEAAPSNAILKTIKNQLAQQGIFRHADMFAYAEQLLKRSPTLSDRLSLRFPMMFIDEMQDTSWQQEHLLNRIFDTKSIVQRYGDVNQRILPNEDGAEHLTFPLPNALPISTSKRFGPAIAAAVTGVQISGHPVTGERPDVHRPLLIAYATNQIHRVVEIFGQHVLQRFDDDCLKQAHVKALCARKKGDGKVEPGRHLGDYWPALAAPIPSASNLPERLWDLLSNAPSRTRAFGTMAERAGEIRRAILLVLRSAKSSAVADVRDGPQLLRRLQQNGHDINALQKLTRNLAITNVDYAQEAVRLLVPEMLFPTLKPLLPSELTLADFRELSLFSAVANAQHLTRPAQSHCVVEHGARSINIPIGTVASMKGETHLATLVLESYGGQSRRFDLKEGLDVLAGISKTPKNTQKLLLGQFRNMYVAMSRPTSFLCVAINAERLTQQCKDTLTASWDIEMLT